MREKQNTVGLNQNEKKESKEEKQDQKSHNSEKSGRYGKYPEKEYPAGDTPGKRKRGFYTRRISYFVRNPDAVIDYKRVDILVKFISDKGKITPKRFTGLSASHQRKIAKAIKRARHAGLLPYSVK